MFARLGCLFVLVPLLELALLLQVGRWVGVLPTVIIVAVTGILGAWLARTEGLRTLARFQAELARGRMPGGALMDGAAILVGGAFLLTPGVLTDIVGFSLLFPPTRRLLQGWASARLMAAIRRGTLRVHVVGDGGGRGDRGDDDPTPPRPGEIVR